MDYKKGVLRLQDVPVCPVCGASHYVGVGTAWNRRESNKSRDRRLPKVHKLCQLHKLLDTHYGEPPRPPPPSPEARTPHTPATHQYSLKAQLAECIPLAKAHRSSQSETLRKCHSSKFPRRLRGPGLLPAAGPPAPRPAPAPHRPGRRGEGALRQWRASALAARAPCAAPDSPRHAPPTNFRANLFSVAPRVSHRSPVLRALSSARRSECNFVIVINVIVYVCNKPT